MSNSKLIPLCNTEILRSDSLRGVVKYAPYVLHDICINGWCMVSGTRWRRFAWTQLSDVEDAETHRFLAVRLCSACYSYVVCGIVGKPELIGYDACDAVSDLHEYLPRAMVPLIAPGGDEFLELEPMELVVES